MLLFGGRVLGKAMNTSLKREQTPQSFSDVVETKRVVFQKEVGKLIVSAPDDVLPAVERRSQKV